MEKRSDIFLKKATNTDFLRKRNQNKQTNKAFQMNQCFEKLNIYNVAHIATIKNNSNMNKNNTDTFL